MNIHFKGIVLRPDTQATHTLKQDWRQSKIPFCDIMTQAVSPDDQEPVIGTQQRWLVYGAEASIIQVLLGHLSALAPFLVDSDNTEKSQAFHDTEDSLTELVQRMTGKENLRVCLNA